MPNAHARYWIDESVKNEIETIAQKMERSASWLAEKLLRAGLEDLKAQAAVEKKQLKK
jgi:predicted transcriptional regulator